MILKRIKIYVGTSEVFLGCSIFATPINIEIYFFPVDAPIWENIKSRIGVSASEKALSIEIFPSAKGLYALS